MKKIVYSLLVIALVFCGACKQKSTPTFKSNNFSNGKAGEMILAIDTMYWTPAAIKCIRGVFLQSQLGLPQNQPMFDILQCSNNDFSASFSRHRNIVQFDFNKGYAGNQYELKKNPYSNPQVQVVIRGNNQDSCLALFLEHQDEIMQALYDNDIARLQNAHRNLNNPNLEKKIKEKFGLSMTIPESYIVGREEPDFLWLLCRTPKNDRCIMIYKSPSYELSKDNIVAERNRITKAYIMGAVQGAYPIVSEMEGFPLAKDYKLHYHEGMELRGLWSSVRDKMGGPFYSFSMHAPENDGIITIDGFVYAPQEEKRDYLREVEAIVKSVK